MTTLRLTPYVGFLLATLAFAQPAADMPRPVPPVLQRYPAVTVDRLRNPAPGDWLMNRRTYDGWGYSPLDQITPANVARLNPLWVFEGYEITDPWVIMLGFGHNYDKIVKLPSKRLTLIMLANSGGLAQGYNLENASVTSSPFVKIFLRLFI